MIKIKTTWKGSEVIMIANCRHCQKLRVGPQSNLGSLCHQAKPCCFHMKTVGSPDAGLVETVSRA